MMEMDVRKVLAKELALLVGYLDILLDEEFPAYNDNAGNICRSIGRCEVYAEFLGITGVEKQVIELYHAILIHIKIPGPDTLDKIIHLRALIRSELEDIEEYKTPRQVMMDFGNYREV